MSLTDDFLTTAQAARRYGWALSSVVRWCQKGWLPALKIGADSQGRYLIRRTDAERFTPPPRGPAKGRQKRG